MPTIAAVSKIELPFKIKQEDVKAQARALFVEHFPQVDRLMPAFDNTEIITRNFCKPISYYAEPNTFEQRNDDYILIALEYAVKAVEDCIKKSGIDKTDITDIIFISTTGLATPSIDALILTKCG
jgi:alkylresorcinol/alkylpyrone synthase